MSAWVLIPCLVGLRTEFNVVAPQRDKGADGAIGDSSHTSSSDHTPDEDSDVLRDHDADSKNEVHALDIDSDGPWPDGSGREAGGWFDRKINEIVERERAEYLHPTTLGRLSYVIWRGRIASRSNGWKWEKRSKDDHYDHAHFSGRYLTATENDTRPWGVEEEDVPLTPAEISLIADTVVDRLLAAPLEDPYDTGTPKRRASVSAWLRYSPSRATTASPARVDAARDQTIAAVNAIEARIGQTENAIAAMQRDMAALLARQDQVVTPEALAAAIRDVLREGVSQ